MKTLILKKNENIDYKKTILELLRNAPQNGYSVDEMMMAVKAIKVVSKAGKQVELEDAVYEFVKKRVRETKYAKASEDLANFVTDME